MRFLLKTAMLLDAINDRIGRMMMWCILAATLISASNAVVRKAVGVSSNAWLEVQWYLFAAVFMLGGGYAFLRNVHVRIDFLSSRFSSRVRNVVDLIGILAFVFPLCWLMVSLGWPVFERAWLTGEMSSNAGGLIRWPAYLLVPAGFTLLMAQGLSEIVKRLAFLTGYGPDVLAQKVPDDAEALARDLAQEAQSSAAGKA